jgi:maltose alpha-D-glucosyltransferase/alpha-amylase
MLTDAFAQDDFACTVLHLIRNGATLPASDGELHFRPTHALQSLGEKEAPEIRRPDSEQSNSSLIIDDTMVLKVIRHLAPGVHPEIEMGRYLTDKGYAHAPAMLGDVTRLAADGTPWVLMTLQQFVDNQGDAWQWTLETLARALRQPLQATDAAPPLLGLTQFAAILGQRLGELHAVLASPTEDEAFAPVIGGPSLVSMWAEHALRQLDSACEVLRSAGDLNEEMSDMVQGLLDRKEALRELVLGLAAQANRALSIRIHGDFHLGQVLVTAGDAYIVDFEGEPMRTLDERREKRSPWVDVAGLLRSHAYAAAVAAIRDAQVSATPALDAFDAGSIALGTPTTGAPVVAEQTLAEQAAMLNTFLADSRRALLDAYRAAVPPQVLESGELLLDLFLIEKAAYEVCYEAANRPSWIGVPLSGLSGIADRLLKPEAGQF